MYKTIFLSDFHIRNDHDFEQGIQTIKHALHTNPDHLVLGGDITDLPNPPYLKKLVNFLDQAGIFNETMLTVVPGNHDIFPLSKRPPWITLGIPSLFRATFQHLFEPISCHHLQDSSFYPVGKRLTPRIALVALDSTARNANPTRWACGEIPPIHLTKTAEFFTSQKGTTHRLVVLHHRPWRTLASSESAHFPMGMSSPPAENTMKQLQPGRPTLILAGHYHTFGDIERRKSRKTFCFGAGISGGADEEEGLHGYHTILLGSNGKISITQTIL